MWNKVIKYQDAFRSSKYVNQKIKNKTIKILNRFSRA